VPILVQKGGFMLGLEVQRSIREAWLRLRGKILSDPDELNRRLARRRMKSLTSPPRAWCVAIRASDRRITPAHWVISPEHAMDLNHPEHAYEPIEHEVTIQKHAIRRYCNPVSFSREDAEDVARMLGTSHAQLLHARKRGVFYENFIPHLGGKPGPAVPLLSPNGKLFDPGFGRNWARPHPVWGADWEFLSHLFPDDFEQTVLRRPYFARINKRAWHPDDPPDFWGWRWICPGCKNPVKMVYYPVPVRMIFDSGIGVPALNAFVDPVIEKKLCDADLPPQPVAAFACHGCHGIQYFNTIRPAAAWNQYVSTISGGLLYGREVQRPADFVAQRRRTRVRLLNREAPVRRKVLARLRNGWSKEQIAVDLGISVHNVRVHLGRICKEEEVSDVWALARKLKFAKQPRASRAQLDRARRVQVAEMMLGNCSYQQMGEKLEVSIEVIGNDVSAIYRAHGVKASGSVASRRALAEKLGVRYASRGDEIRSKVAELRERGLTWREVGRAMGMKWNTVAKHGGKPRSRKAQQLMEGAILPEGATKV
jgi:hypothetical protein